MLHRFRRRTVPVTVVSHGRTAEQLAQLASEEIVRLRGVMQSALNALNASPYQSAYNEARARRVLRDALKYEGWWH